MLRHFMDWLKVRTIVTLFRCALMPFIAEVVLVFILAFIHVFVKAFPPESLKSLRRLKGFLSIVFLQIFNNLLKQSFVLNLTFLVMFSLFNEFLASLNFVELINIGKWSTTTLTSFGLIPHDIPNSCLATYRRFILVQFLSPCASFSRHTLTNIIEHGVKSLWLGLCSFGKW